MTTMGWARSPAALALAVTTALSMAGCAGLGSTPIPTTRAPVPAPQGLDAGHPLVIVEELGGPTFIMGTFDPRAVTLYADGTLVASDPASGRILSIMGTRLAPDRLDEAWDTVVGSGLAIGRVLELPGLFDAGTTQVIVNDGTTTTNLSLYALGSEPSAGEPTFRPDEAALRANATRAIGLLREMAGADPYVPPGLLLWWAPFEPGSVAPRIVPWTPPVDLATAGDPVGNPIFDRCVLLEGDVAAEVAALASTLAPDVVVTQAGTNYAIGVRPIYPDEAGSVTCAAPR